MIPELHFRIEGPSTYRKGRNDERDDVILSCERIYDRVRIKRIATGKCDLFFHYRDAKKMSFYYFR